MVNVRNGYRLIGAMLLLPLWLSLFLEISPAGRVTYAGFAMPGGCTFHQLTDHGCLTCGMTRAFVATAHGDWLQGMKFHPLGGLLFVLLAVFGASLLAGRVRLACNLLRGWPLLVGMLFGFWGARLSGFWFEA